jgi:hypothetical protein
MGQEMTSAGSREIHVDVRAPATIEKVHIMKNGRILLREFCDRKEESFVIPHDQPELDEDTYYVRIVLRDREMAWLSPIWVRK